MSKHTPGPWSIMQAGDSNNRTQIANANNDPFIAVAGETVSQQMRDARLIAAAPDLLEALQMVASSDVTLHPYIFNAINAALAKCNTSPQ